MLNYKLCYIRNVILEIETYANMILIPVFSLLTKIYPICTYSKSVAFYSA